MDTETAAGYPVPTDALRRPLSLFDVSGRTAVVTGASGAYGRTIAVALGALGCRLLLASGSKEPLEAVAREAADAGGTVETLVRRPDTLDDARDIVAAANARQVGVITDPAFPPDLQAWGRAFVELRPAETAAKVAPRPMPIVHGTADKGVPVSDPRLLAEPGGPNAELRLVGGARPPRSGPRAFSIPASG